MFLVIGTSAAVYPAASLVPYAKQGGAKVIEINTDETPSPIKWTAPSEAPPENSYPN